MGCGADQETKTKAKKSKVRSTSLQKALQRGCLMRQISKILTKFTELGLTIIKPTQTGINRNKNSNTSRFP
jgi:hypothetical protein